MKILLLTQYFPPETGAPQNRLYSLAGHLVEAGDEVTVVTANPSYPKSEIYSGYENKFMREQDGKLTIYRCPIYTSKKKNIIPRLLNYFSFVFTSMWVGLFRLKRHDIIICESPPLFLGITALMIHWFKRSKLVFNVSDLWPKTAEELGIVTNRLLLSMSYALEKFIYHQSSLVSGQTQGIMDDIQSRFPDVPFHLLRNGIDTAHFQSPGDRKEFRIKHGIGEDQFVITYAGIIGHAQGLEVVLHAAHQLSHEKKLSFVFVGDGPVKNDLMQLANDLNLNNCFFIPSVSRNEMPDVIAACDCYVTPLRNSPIFLGAIPSKIFEPLYYGKPAIMGVNGEAKTLFVEEGKCALHFEPENPTALAAAIQLLSTNQNLYNELGKNGRKYVVDHFDRKKMAALYRAKLLQL